MDDIYALNDAQIQALIGKRLKSARLRQNITQNSLAESSGISLSSVKKMEKGEIGSFETFIRVLRTLGALGDLNPLTAEEEMSPIEYYEFVNFKNSRQRLRASGVIKKTEEKTSEW